MSNFFQDIHIARLKEVYDRLGHEIVTERTPLAAEYSVTPEPVSYDKRGELAYKPIQCGEKWGELWDCGWFRVRGEVPKSWEGGYVTPSKEPGLGVELNEAVALAHPYDSTRLHLDMAQHPLGYF